MHDRAIPSTSERLPVIGLGTWRTFDVGRSSPQRAALETCLAEFWALGGRVLDTSPMYGRAEEIAGDLVASLGLRDRLSVATKVWTTGRRRGVEQMLESMRKLRVETVDLMQVHNLVDIGVHLETLREWKHEGRIRYLGVTHYAARQHGEVARVLESSPVDFVQINYSVIEREAEQRVLPLAAERGIAVVVNRPFGGGGALGRLRGRSVPPWAPEIECTSWAQLMLKFVVSHPAVTVAIPATSNVEHLRDNMRAGEGVLPDERQRERIAAAAQQ